MIDVELVCCPSCSLTLVTPLGASKMVYIPNHQMVCSYLRHVTNHSLLSLSALASVMSTLCLQVYQYIEVNRLQHNYAKFCGLHGAACMFSSKLLNSAWRTAANGLGTCKKKHAAVVTSVHTTAELRADSPGSGSIVCGCHRGAQLP